MKMQKLILNALLLGATVPLAQAQTKAGTLLLSGSLNYFKDQHENSGSGTTADLAKNQQFSFRPQAGLFVADNLALGLVVGIGSSENTIRQNVSNSADTYINKSTSKEWNAGPFVRYYKMVGEKVGFYGQLAGGYQSTKRKSRTTFSGSNPYPDLYSSDVKETGGYASITPGFVFFPTEKLGLEFTLGNLGYLKSKAKFQNPNSGQPAGERSSSAFSANFAPQYVTVGASFYLSN